ncbi:developmentally regulated phosphoprotein [Trypanosoma brucei gambiense DAL972]|uniref:Protein-serine/threonine kinase n=2 Tax=Trypanosoma brucei TaxID=5691 RepID=C9ZHT4_TRYB9|nr:developmentally regulated phosphoprotein [Trypanosoma brucei gambiense DAL972]CBH08845.1 developmentally regulated phosphoprotein [Trypanosoma brucei gambiense DAL972]|eukprot:XP_011771286.1 developmentally regulated phosphoprotein [Trypanosoma brucei gambiense DAL972]
MRRLLCLSRTRVSFMRWKFDEVAHLRDQVKALDNRIAFIEESQTIKSLLAFYSSRPLSNINTPSKFISYCAESDHNAKVFCHAELPTLLARLITTIDSFPCGLNAMLPIVSVRNTFLDSFKKLIKCDFPEDGAKSEQFLDVVKEIEEAHMKREVLLTIGTGLLQLKDLLSCHKRFILRNKWSGSYKEMEASSNDWLLDLTGPLDDFCFRMVNYNFLSRMLLNSEVVKNNMADLVDLQIDLEKVVRNAVEDAQSICTNFYGSCPGVKFIILKDEKPMKLAYLSSTISYVVIELMKNAFRATVESHSDLTSPTIDCDDAPQVEVLVNIKEGSSHACIRISDEGLGMTVAQAKMAMSYAHTSAKKCLIGSHLGQEDGGENVAPLAGYGFGLPMSRVYARHFGGDLVLNTMEGYGTSVYYFIQI